MCFWAHRSELYRWQTDRCVRTERKANGELTARWHPSMPVPQWSAIAYDREIAIHLPVPSVKSFFEETKKEIRALMKEGKLPADHVRPPLLLLPISRPV